MLRLARTTAISLVISSFAIFASAQSGGDALFVSRCSSCHGKDATGKTSFAQKVPIPDLRSASVQSKSDRELYEGIGHGVGHKQYPHVFLMRGMSETEVISLVKFIRSLK